MIPTCEICGLEMKLKHRIKSKKKYRIRRFICQYGCGYELTIFADGYRDLVTEPEKAIEAVKRKFDQENKNANK